MAIVKNEEEAPKKDQLFLNITIQDIFALILL